MSVTVTHRPRNPPIPKILLQLYEDLMDIKVQDATQARRYVTDTQPFSKIFVVPLGQFVLSSSTCKNVSYLETIMKTICICRILELYVKI